MLIDIKNSKEFSKSIKETVIVDFYADWCQPCKALNPIIKEISQELTYIDFIKVNVDTLPDIAQTYSITSIPTILVFKGSHIIGKIDTFANKIKLVSDIKSALS